MGLTYGLCPRGACPCLPEEPTPAAEDSPLPPTSHPNCSVTSHPGPWSQHLNCAPHTELGRVCAPAVLTTHGLSAQSPQAHTQHTG